MKYLHWNAGRNAYEIYGDDDTPADAGLDPPVRKNCPHVAAINRMFHQMRQWTELGDEAMTHKASRGGDRRSSRWRDRH